MVRFVDKADVKGEPLVSDTRPSCGGDCLEIRLRSLSGLWVVVAEINKYGRLRRLTGIPDVLGLDLDKGRCIKLDE